MAKLQDCQFIQIKIDNKIISGSSEEKDYKNWMEGYSSANMASIAGPDGVFFDDVQASIVVTKESSSLFEQYLKRGYKEISVTIVHRGSDKYDHNYETQRTTYKTCNFHGISFEHGEKLFMNLVFSFEGSIEATFNVPNATGTGLDKIGPITYDIPSKSLK